VTGRMHATRHLGATIFRHATGTTATEPEQANTQGLYCGRNAATPAHLPGIGRRYHARSAHSSERGLPWKQ
jgi:hypothetical protein